MATIPQVNCDCRDDSHLSDATLRAVLKNGDFPSVPTERIYRLTPNAEVFNQMTSFALPDHVGGGLGLSRDLNAHSVHPFSENKMYYRDKNINSLYMEIGEENMKQLLSFGNCAATLKINNTLCGNPILSGFVMRSRFRPGKAWFFTVACFNLKDSKILSCLVNKEYDSSIAAVSQYDYPFADDGDIRVAAALVYYEPSINVSIWRLKDFGNSYLASKSLKFCMTDDVAWGWGRADFKSGNWLGSMDAIPSLQVVQNTVKNDGNIFGAQFYLSAGEASLNNPKGLKPDSRMARAFAIGVNCRNSAFDTWLSRLCSYIHPGQKGVISSLKSYSFSDYFHPGRRSISLGTIQDNPYGLIHSCSGWGSILGAPICVLEYITARGTGDQQLYYPYGCYRPRIIGLFTGDSHSSPMPYNKIVCLRFDEKMLASIFDDEAFRYIEGFPAGGHHMTQLQPAQLNVFTKQGEREADAFLEGLDLALLEKKEASGEKSIQRLYSTMLEMSRGDKRRKEELFSKVSTALSKLKQRWVEEDKRDKYDERMTSDQNLTDFYQASSPSSHRVERRDFDRTSKRKQRDNCDYLEGPAVKKERFN